MTIKEFITKAIEGGFAYTALGGFREMTKEEFITWVVADYHFFCAMCLDPKVWQAVGKVEGWDEINHGLTLSSHSLPRTTYNASAGEWHYKMLEFANHLADGKSIEEFLQTL